MGRGNSSTFNISMESLNSEFNLDLEEDSFEIEMTLREGYGPITFMMYKDLIGKPKIEGVTLEGDKSFAELGLVIDNELLDNSPNPVQNQVIAQALSAIEEQLNIYVIDCGTAAT